MINKAVITQFHATLKRSFRHVREVFGVFKNTKYINKLEIDNFYSLFTNWFIGDLRFFYSKRVIVNTSLFRQPRYNVLFNTCKIRLPKLFKTASNDLIHVSWASPGNFPGRGIIFRQKIFSLFMHKKLKKRQALPFQG